MIEKPTCICLHTSQCGRQFISPPAREMNLMSQHEEANQHLNVPSIIQTSRSNIYSLWGTHQSPSHLFKVIIGAVSMVISLDHMAGSIFTLLTSKPDGQSQFYSYLTTALSHKIQMISGENVKGISLSKFLCNKYHPSYSYFFAIWGCMYSSIKSHFLTLLN